MPAPIPPAAASGSRAGGGLSRLHRSAGAVLGALPLAAPRELLRVVLRPAANLLDFSFEVLGSGCPECRERSAKGDKVAQRSAKGDKVAHPREDVDLGDELMKAQHFPVIRE